MRSRICLTSSRPPYKGRAAFAMTASCQLKLIYMKDIISTIPKPQRDQIFLTDNPLDSRRIFLLTERESKNVMPRFENTVCDFLIFIYIKEIIIRTLKVETDLILLSVNLYIKLGDGGC